MTPVVNWNQYITGVGIAKLDSVIVSQPKYMTALQTILAENKMDEWKAYLRWSLLNKSDNVLTTEIEKANWIFTVKRFKEPKTASER